MLVGAIVTPAGTFVGVEQRHEVLNQQREIERVGDARAQDQAVLIQRHALLGSVVTNLRPQVTAGEAHAGVVGLTSIRF